MKSQLVKKGARVYVAMSGGVDSSVAAALLKKQGYEVTGVFMRPWSPKATSSKFQVPSSKQAQNSPPKADPPLAEKFETLNDDFCLWKQDREDAMRVAARIGIPLLTWDFSKEYKKEVTDYMIREYRAGRTPNPDVMCNKHIKFGLFLNKALKEGADHIATGHYVKIKKSKIKNQNDKLKFKNVFKLFKAKDSNKDQSYFLWTLTQKQLKRCLFPIGEYIKPEVRKMAKKFNLPTASKKDSQGVCFIGPLDMKGFLKQYIKPKRGKILDLTGNLMGFHDGAYYYTIGQRRGLDIKHGQGPYFVIRKDIKNNLIYVGSKNELDGEILKTDNLNWITKISLPRELNVRVRYRARLSVAVVKRGGEVVFKKPEAAITPGQSIVFYRGNELIGGGIIQ